MDDDLTRCIPGFALIGILAIMHNHSDVVTNCVLRNGNNRNSWPMRNKEIIILLGVYDNSGHKHLRGIIKSRSFTDV